MFILTFSIKHADKIKFLFYIIILHLIQYMEMWKALTIPQNIQKYLLLIKNHYLIK